VKKSRKYCASSDQLERIEGVIVSACGLVWGEDFDSYSCSYLYLCLDFAFCGACGVLGFDLAGGRLDWRDPWRYQHVYLFCEHLGQRREIFEIHCLCPDASAPFPSMVTLTKTVNMIAFDDNDACGAVMDFGYVKSRMVTFDVF
jgi:hypothetical protein